ncbi:hypothetical protein MauCBS54593_001194 [Microsporum audouinii]
MSEYYPTANESLVEKVLVPQTVSQIASSSSSTSSRETVAESDECYSSRSDSLLSGGEPRSDELPEVLSGRPAPGNFATGEMVGTAFATSVEAAESGGSDGESGLAHHFALVKKKVRTCGCLLLLLYVFWAGMMFGSSQHQKCKSSYPGIVYSPARTVQEYQSVRFDGDIKTINSYKGPPSNAIDEAWKALYDAGPLLVDKMELEAVGKESIELPSRPGKHLVKLAVFHQLHCLDYVRKYVHREHYRIDDSHAAVSGIDHADHCIDMIRQALSCSADPTLITFKQDGPFDTVEADFSATHACTNFEKTRDWAKDRAINMTEEIIRNPEPFKDAVIVSLHGHGNRTSKA